MNVEEIDMLIANAEYEPQQLKDYITNLQKENEKLKQRSIAGVKVFVSNETYNNYKGTLQEQLEDYKSRCEKAIEYIKQQDMKYYGAVVETKMGIILHILGGDE